ncbi:MAG: peptidylprolyl isomerase [Piscirickettsiaceae bacterium]|nr:MAG: peptidylprolyl isomerase [Piscirickettsiaceae bacterium]PCI65983.1 MAG: peptidylprolyl isomerase [Piscirickettsiaceae bacterium]
MPIQTNTVVRFHYTLKNDAGNTLESSNGQEPTAYLHGYSNIIAGLQKDMEGKTQGDTFSSTVQPEDGYGQRIEGSTQRVPIKHLMGAKKWRPGMVATVQTEHGQKQVTVIKPGKFMAEVDNNHPLAGQTLHFDIEIVDIRDATAEEIAHKHVHGAGGHHH